MQICKKLEGGGAMLNTNFYNLSCAIDPIYPKGQYIAQNCINARAFGLTYVSSPRKALHTRDFRIR